MARERTSSTSEDRDGSGHSATGAGAGRAGGAGDEGSVGVDADTPQDRATAARMQLVKARQVADPLVSAYDRARRVYLASERTEADRGTFTAAEETLRASYPLAEIVCAMMDLAVDGRNALSIEDVVLMKVRRGGAVEHRDEIKEFATQELLVLGILGLLFPGKTPFVDEKGKVNVELSHKDFPVFTLATEVLQNREAFGPYRLPKTSHSRSDQGVALSASLLNFVAMIKTHAAGPREAFNAHPAFAQLRDAIWGVIVRLYSVAVYTLVPRFVRSGDDAPKREHLISAWLRLTGDVTLVERLLLLPSVHRDFLVGWPAPKEGVTHPMEDLYEHVPDLKRRHKLMSLYVSSHTLALAQVHIARNLQAPRRTSEYERYVTELQVEWEKFLLRLLNKAIAHEDVATIQYIASQLVFRRDEARSIVEDRYSTATPAAQIHLRGFCSEDYLATLEASKAESGVAEAADDSAAAAGGASADVVSAGGGASASAVVAAAADAHDEEWRTRPLFEGLRLTHFDLLKAMLLEKLFRVYDIRRSRENALELEGRSAFTHIACSKSLPQLISVLDGVEYYAIQYKTRRDRELGWAVGAGWAPNPGLDSAVSHDVGDHHLWPIEKYYTDVEAFMVALLKANVWARSFVTSWNESAEARKKSLWDASQESGLWECAEAAAWAAKQISVDDLASINNSFAAPNVRRDAAHAASLVDRALRADSPAIRVVAAAADRSMRRLSAAAAGDAGGASGSGEDDGVERDSVAGAHAAAGAGADVADTSHDATTEFESAGADGGGAGGDGARSVDSDSDDEDAARLWGAGMSPAGSTELLALRAELSALYAGAENDKSKQYGVIQAAFPWKKIIRLLVNHPDPSKLRPEDWGLRPVGPEGLTHIEYLVLSVHALLVPDAAWLAKEGEADAVPLYRDLFSLATGITGLRYYSAAERRALRHARRETHTSESDENRPDLFVFNVIACIQDALEVDAEAFVRHPAASRLLERVLGVFEAIPPILSLSVETTYVSDSGASGEGVLFTCGRTSALFSEDHSPLHAAVRRVPDEGFHQRFARHPVINFWRNTWGKTIDQHNGAAISPADIVKANHASQTPVEVLPPVLRRIAALRDCIDKLSELEQYRLGLLRHFSTHMSIKSSTPIQDVLWVYNLECSMGMWLKKPARKEPLDKALLDFNAAVLRANSLPELMSAGKRLRDALFKARQERWTEWFGRLRPAADAKEVSMPKPLSLLAHMDEDGAVTRELFVQQVVTCFQQTIEPILIALNAFLRPPRLRVGSSGTASSAGSVDSAGSTSRAASGGKPAAGAGAASAATGEASSGTGAAPAASASAVVAEAGSGAGADKASARRAAPSAPVSAGLFSITGLIGELNAWALGESGAGTAPASSARGAGSDKP